jgi:HAD superfamily hydrolase (TIGR01509 family)
MKSIYKDFIANCKALILDMDGVLVDSEPIHGESFRLFFEKLGVDCTEEFIHNLVGHSVNSNIQTINETFLADRPLDIEEGVKMRDSLYLELITNIPLKPIKGIESLILKCNKKGLRLGLATSSAREQIEVILNSLSKNGDHKIDYKNVFDVIVGGDEVANKKPSPDIYKKVIRKLGIAPDKCLAIEDSEAGLMSAKANGIFCVALKNQYLKIHDNLTADMIVDSIYEVVNLM